MEIDWNSFLFYKIDNRKSIPQNIIDCTKIGNMKNPDNTRKIGKIPEIRQNPRITDKPGNPAGYFSGMKSGF